MNFDFSLADKAFEEVIEFLKKEFRQISTGRANPALLDSIVVDSYGSLQPIKNIASLNVEDARTLRISPWDGSQVKAIEKAIVDSSLPFSVSSDGTGVRVHIPQMTEESKKSILKVLKDKLEDARVRVRNVRHDTLKKIDDGEAEGLYAEDAKNTFKEELQKKVDGINKELETIYQEKETDIMSV
ncbi:MAG: ribosome recycling factor [Candidatus Pacebacteria bacterium]|nr:ribosome recycling factor [Candidatus Paceibacterota bacterium]